MAITYPRTLPSTFRFAKADLEVVWGNSSPEKTRGGAVQVIDFADPYWVYDITSTEMLMTDYEVMRAWLNTLKGGLKTFLAHPGTRPRPSSYATDAALTALTRAGGGTFDGTFTVTSFPVASSIATVTPASLRAPASLVLKAGDFIGLSQSGRYSLHRVVEDNTTNASGNFTTGAPLIVEPWIKTTLFTTGAIANILKPLGEFFVDPGSIEGETNSRSSPISFRGISKVQV